MKLENLILNISVHLFVLHLINLDEVWALLPSKVKRFHSLYSYIYVYVSYYGICIISENTKKEKNKRIASLTLNNFH